MAIHESGINFTNLIRDLAEMYPFDISAVILAELIANSLDAKASIISINFNPADNVLVVKDNGVGMDSNQFAEYHDFAAGLKIRGAGIGFAGLGAKVSFNIADRVITETKSQSFECGSNWYLKTNKKLVWEDIEPRNLRENGTRVEVHLRKNIKATYSGFDEIVQLLKRHYLPLLDIKFLELYEAMGLYSKDIKFIINNKPVKPIRLSDNLSLTNIKEIFPLRKNKIYGYGIFGLAKNEYPIAPDISGVLLCTHGKVIKPDFFNQFPGQLGPYIFGAVEIPEFIDFLTTSKTDFMPKGKHRFFENIYGPIRQDFKNWLSTIGVESPEILDSDEAIELERELKKLSDSIPELSEFFGFWIKKEVLKKSVVGPETASISEGVTATVPDGNGIKGKGGGLNDQGNDPGQAINNDDKGTEKAKSISRKAPRGPKIAFIEAPDRSELAWVEGNNVIINSGHPSYVKCRSNSKLQRLHNLFAIASSIQRYLVNVSEAPDPLFMDRMMMAWGHKWVMITSALYRSTDQKTTLERI